IESSLHQQQRRLVLLAKGQLQRADSRLAGLRQRLLLQAPGRRLEQAREQLERQQTLLHKGISRQLALLRQRFVSAATPLHLLSPLATLDRGYAIAFDKQHLAVRDAATLSKNDLLNLKFASGEAECRVEKVKTGKN
ncbi:exodeoxyribonuclease VII large subunit, partial [Solemya elarraichensis gill symbiont]